MDTYGFWYEHYTKREETRPLQVSLAVDGGGADGGMFPRLTVLRMLLAVCIRVNRMALRSICSERTLENGENCLQRSPSVCFFGEACLSIKSTLNGNLETQLIHRSRAGAAPRGGD